eukprot:CAMPEP_0197878464 /NCGR_PEP_ID=MMETSP1439-20131203/6849_1 /TAXON_ID=66791 /ORGANISM="Gonyaulax spinifera, Strain CCMP409" /LENGTH=297 /DNA_ID=CAMNT_0043497885 /DNA_START=160 /DNA_END=1051 /DNA_ORIENTATION=-
MKAARRQRALQQAAGLVSSQAAVSGQTAVSQMAAIAETEADDRRFWSEQWRAMESSLQQLLEASEAPGGPREGLAFTQTANDTDAKSLAATSKPVASATDPATVVPKDDFPVKVPKLNLNPKSVADLAPALAMLKGLYEDSKERIAQLNAREKKTRKQFEDREALHKARIAEIEARFKNHTLREEFYKNETRDENKFFTYWQGVRERQHRQFHTSLKIQHGTLSKVKSMIDVYEKTMAGKTDQTEVKKDLAKVGVVPEVVLLQEAWHSAAPFFGDALVAVRAASSELESTPPSHLKE